MARGWHSYGHCILTSEFGVCSTCVLVKIYNKKLKTNSQLIRYPTYLSGHKSCVLRVECTTKVFFFFFQVVGRHALLQVDDHYIGSEVWQNGRAWAGWGKTFWFGWLIKQTFWFASLSLSFQTNFVQIKVTFYSEGKKQIGVSK